jgi:hypothetical protein
VADIKVDDFYSIARRTADVRAKVYVTRFRLPNDFRQDLEQLALLELWSKRIFFDGARASWQTFAEHVVANRLSSVLRAMRREGSGLFKAGSIQMSEISINPWRDLDLALCIAQILVGVSDFDRAVAGCLMRYSAVETATRLSVSRATVYRAIERLRLAFIAAGIGERRKVSASERKPASDRGRLQ